MCCVVCYNYHFDIGVTCVVFMYDSVDIVIVIAISNAMIVGFISDFNHFFSLIPVATSTFNIDVVINNNSNNNTSNDN